MNIMFSSILGTDLTFGSTAIVFATSIILGFIISLVYMQTNKKEGYTASMALSLVMLPFIISIIIMLVGNSVAKAFSLAGAFTIVRFRSEAASPKDLTYVFSTLAAGLASGMGYIACAAFYVAVYCIIMIVLTNIQFGSRKDTPMLLKVAIPENLDYNDLFEDIFEKHTDFCKLINVRTAEFGSVFKLEYAMKLNGDCSSKEFIDMIRTRNGNLTVMLSQTENGSIRQ